MDIVIYGSARAPRSAIANSIKSEPRRGLFACFMDALRETRRRQARHEIAKYAHLMALREHGVPNLLFRDLSGNHGGKSLVICPITGYPCEGNRSHLCEDYGCARKGGLSPNSDENF